MRAKKQYLFIDFEFTMPERNVRMKDFFAEIILTAYSSGTHYSDGDMLH